MYDLEHTENAQDVVDFINEEDVEVVAGDETAIVSSETHARIRGSVNEDITVDRNGEGFILRQDADRIYLSRAEAEALVLVLDTFSNDNE